MGWLEREGRGIGGIIEIRAKREDSGRAWVIRDFNEGDEKKRLIKLAFRDRVEN